MVVSAKHFTDVTNGYERTTDGLWVHRGKLSVGMPGTAPAQAGDINASRASPPGAGAYYFGGNSGKYLYYDGTNFSLVGGTLNFVPAANTINTAALQANAVQQLLASHVAGVSWATPSAGPWHETPIQATGTATVDMGVLRIEASVPISNNTPGALTYIGMGTNGSVAIGLAVFHQPTANYITTLSGIHYIVGVVPGTYRFAIFVLVSGGVATIWNGVESRLYVTAQKR